MRQTTQGHNSKRPYPVTRTYKKSKGFSWFLIGTACGSLLTYFLDPSRGTTRRVLLRDKGIKWKKESEKYFSKQWRNLKNHYQGLIAKTFINKKLHVSDDILLARIRSKIGRALSNARAVKVDVRDGVVTLSGPIQSQEQRELLRRLHKVSGVHQIINKLKPDIHENLQAQPEGAGSQYLQ